MQKPLTEMWMRKHWVNGGKIENEWLAAGMGKFPNRNSGVHHGWDLDAPLNTPIYAISDGIISYKDQVEADIKSKEYGKSKGYGMQIILEFNHAGRKLFALYAHLNRRIAKNGGKVKAGELIGLTGNSGNARKMHKEENHLHFEILKTLCYRGKEIGLEDRIDPGEFFGYELYTCRIRQFYLYTLEEKVSTFKSVGVAFSKNNFFTTSEFYTAEEAGQKLGISSENINCVLKFQDNIGFTRSGDKYIYFGIAIRPTAIRKISSRIWNDILLYTFPLTQ